MAPIRRYLRITKYSVLEVRIYLEKPSDAAWLLSSRDPILPRIIQEIRPKVLPKLREENENAKKKGGKRKKGIRDVASQEDFEVALFLTDSSSRHALITKQKQFTSKSKITSTSNKLTGWLSNTNEDPIHVEDDLPPGLLHEDTEDTAKLSDIPEVHRKRKTRDGPAAYEDDTLFVSSTDEEDAQVRSVRKARRRRKRSSKEQVDTDDTHDAGEFDDKKKLALNTSYDGFSIYGKTLCLIVKRKEHKKLAAAARASSSAAQLAGSQMMEHWVSTQANQEPTLDDDEGG